MRRTARIAAGFGLIVAGIAMLALPGPGLLTIAAGVALLARDLRWAERLRRRISRKASREPSSESEMENQAGG